MAACCKACAKGKPCKGCNKQASFGALGFFVPMEAVEQLDSKIRNLHTDILRVTSEPVKSNTQAVDNARLLSSWAPFVTGWKIWLADHYSTLSRTGEGAVTEFEQQQSEYNELLRRTAALGSTSATVSKQDVLESGGTEITSTIKFASVAVIAIVAAYALSKAT